MPLTTSIDDLFTAASQQTAGVAEVSSDQPIYTGRYIAIFSPDASDQAIQHFRDTYSLKVATATSFEAQAVEFDKLADAEVLFFPSIGAAVVSAEAYAATQSGTGSMAVAEADTGGGSTGGTTPSGSGPVSSWEKEVFVYPTGAAPATLANVTYGLDITSGSASTYDGTGIKVCVLDTGLDLTHPDFAGRMIVSASFVGQPVQDGHSHGTHTAGTACGPQNPSTGPRYGIAFNAQLYIGKVLSDSGRGTTASILAGINWALANKCDVVSMSLGSPVGEQTSYTQAGQKALDAGALLVAAAGNDSSRPGNTAQTGAPANSPTIIAVAAVDQNCDVASFSNGGKIEIAGPGVGVLSSVPKPNLYGTKSGTSMATPHVSGIAALWAQSDSSFRGKALWSALTGAAKQLSAGSSDVGAGLVQAPSPGGICQ